MGIAKKDLTLKPDCSFKWISPCTLCLWQTRQTGKAEPPYHVQYTESQNGAQWIRNNVTCVPYKPHGETNARSRVINEDGIYRTWRCCRGSVDYGTAKEKTYGVGHAEATDGIGWLRGDEEVGI